MIERFIITGDTHRVFGRFQALDKTPNTAIIILGDVGLNYTLDENDYHAKSSLCKRNPQIFYCVRGNHEARPSDVPGMELVYDENVDGEVWVEKHFPRIRYFKDWGIYTIDGLRTLVIGGAYSVDKHYRITLGRKWFENEQLTEAERAECMETVKGQKFDLVLAHTCPLSLQPIDLFLRGLDQSTVDNSMEVWLEELINSIKWKLLLWGHYHIDRIEWPYCEIFYTEMENLQDIVERWERYSKTKELDWWIPISPKFKKLQEND